MLSCFHVGRLRSLDAARWPHRRSGAALLAAFLLSGIEPASAEEGSRLRAMNFSLTEIEWDIVNVAAPFCDEAEDTGLMEFERVVDQAMFDQLVAIRGAGGFVEVQFGTRIGNSFAGLGSGVTTGEVEIAIDGASVMTFQYSSDVDGTTPYSEEILLADADVASLQVGSVIAVTGTGSGVSRTNGCGRIDQAITSWYFTSGGKPIIQTYL